METKVVKIEIVGGLTVNSLVLSLESFEALAQSVKVNFDGLMTVNHWVLRSWVWFVKVVPVVHES